MKHNSKIIWMGIAAIVVPITVILFVHFGASIGTVLYHEAVAFIEKGGSIHPAKLRAYHTMRAAFLIIGFVAGIVSTHAAFVVLINSTGRTSESDRNGV